MGYNSQLQFDFIADSYYNSIGHRIIGLIDDLMALGWEIGVDGAIHVIDKGNDYNFILLEKKLSDYVKLAELLEYKEVRREPIVIDLNHKVTGNIQIFFFHDCEDSVKIELYGDKDVHNTNPMHEINSFLSLIYIPIFDWAEVKSIKFIAGYDYEIIKEIKGGNIKEKLIVQMDYPV